jgi:hypothetical protein
VDTASVLEGINSFNYREVQEFLNNNRALFQREETKRINAACREHIAKHNIKVGDWFNYTKVLNEGYNSERKVVYMYELQVLKINRTCLKATGFMISPRHMEIEPHYALDIPIMSVIP